ncbi:fasciclin domain-containing protein [Roseivivax sediminis]|uniref:Uncaracterized surface protein containing fasciclin (FAS1) repeats n=1 Tax=Roseivivax sediminis TaxID=936889 RepID=A0A1I1ZYI5_9RHOB|nr:fasciclin domain-containing protein [Roseivivax sediminis]SFE36731.1 Uncaracterized surface protein containing fasciclin (FAS1) repeats [Roseivivax sediminis]
MFRRTYLSLTAATVLAGAGLGATSAVAQDMNIVETAQEAGDFETLLAAAESAGLVETLTGEGPFTVFAPTDEAFEALPEGTVDELLMEENQDQLTSILTYHVVPGAVMSSDLEDGMEAETVEGSSVTVSIDGDTVMVGDATVTQADIEASNGVIHVIDSVLMP